MTTAAVFYLVVTECQNAQSTNTNKTRTGISQFSLRPVGERTLLINDPGIVAEHEEY